MKEVLKLALLSLLEEGRNSLKRIKVEEIVCAVNQVSVLFSVFIFRYNTYTYTNTCTHTEETD